MVIFDDENELARLYWDVFRPIPGGSPAGIRLWSGADPDWIALREARQHLRSGQLDPDDSPLPECDWETVRELAVKLLECRSKDLQLGLWLAEALISTRGVDGLSEGLFVIRVLLDRYRNNGLYPEDEIDREELVDWMEPGLSRRLMALPITPGVEGKHHFWGDYQAALSSLEPYGTPPENSNESEGIPEVLLPFRDELSTMEPEFLATLLGSLRMAQRQLGRLAATVQRDPSEFFYRTSFALTSFEKLIPHGVIPGEFLPAAAIPAPHRSLEEAVQQDEKNLLNLYERALAPVSIENPVGTRMWSHADPEWLALRQARRGIHPGQLAPEVIPLLDTDWDLVRQLAVTLLEGRTKDLQIALWLTEALVRLQGFAGLFEGLFVVKELLHRYREFGLHPSNEEGSRPGLDFLNCFDLKMAEVLLSIPLTPEVRGARYSYHEYNHLAASLKQEFAGAWDPELARRQEVALEIQRILAATNTDFFDDVQVDITRARLQMDRVSSVFGEITANVFPDMRASLAQCEHLIQRWKASTENPLTRDRTLNIQDPENIENPWERGLAWIRLQRFDRAIDLVESTIRSETIERDRFLRKSQLAQALVETGRYEAAIGILEPLEEQIDRFQLQQWEAQEVVSNVWTLLHACYQGSQRQPQKMRELEMKLLRLAPWKALL